MGAVKMFTPYDLRPTIEITAFVLTGVSTMVVAVRCYCRVWIVGRLKLYDYIMLVALLCTWGLCACNHYQLMFGSGAQSGPKGMPKNLLFGSAVSWYVYHIGYSAVMGMIKLSILVFYLSFATHRMFRILVHISITFVAAVSTLMIFILAFQCPKKPSYAFSPAILKDRGAGHCFDLRIVFYWQAGFSIGSDLVILVLPMPLLVSLRMNTMKRISLMAVFSIGLLVPIASGVRLWGLILWANSGKLARYYGGYLIFWSQVEINTAIICASAPSLQPLVTRVFDKLARFQSPRGAYYYYGDGSNSISEPSVAEMIRSLPRDSISLLEPPDRVYYPSKTQVQEEFQTQVVIVKRSLEEEDIRSRVRAFSNQSPVHSHSTPPSSAFSTPSSSTGPSNMLRSGWI
ncbi:uncharacterized protein K460DRAFT_415403 [Cucurbitaria berberidis CBS 394.84]|uniref:Rhodopsin domain-containing protein n=1 Tax=Cucurbitaria berberidis CBS 394.84 TaxID=1168544 RepID=A0A9P4LC97_9PLEO|nr:uncharacterized protein K460DRAFT_415403 [Cucurbitaria berberidis CBS 394.84]KAF1848944.1 hypothetical protein K460DRAFT_415403 [Cucurbitaria berberidis CBS 394.84]